MFVISFQNFLSLSHFLSLCLFPYCSRDRSTSPKTVQKFINRRICVMKTVSILSAKQSMTLICCANDCIDKFLKHSIHHSHKKIRDEWKKERQDSKNCLGKAIRYSMVSTLRINFQQIDFQSTEINNLWYCKLHLIVFNVTNLIGNSMRTNNYECFYFLCVPFKSYRKLTKGNTKRMFLIVWLLTGGCLFLQKKWNRIFL